MSQSAATPLRIVYLEDDLGAYELVRAMLAADGIEAEVEHVDTAADYRRALAPLPPDLVLSDFNLPDIDGHAALALKKELCPAVPFIFVSGALGEETAVDALRNGATDFVLKGSLARLASSVRRALAESREHRERLRAEQSLRASEERFRRLTANAPDAIFRYRFDPAPGYEYISPAIEAIVGYRPEEFYADPELATRLVPAGERDELRTIARSRIVPLGIREIRWLARTGRVVVTEQRFVPVRDELGQLIAVEGIARDITDRKHTEEQIHLLSEAIEQSPVGVVITDARNHALFANARLLEMCGYEGAELLGRDPQLLLSPENPGDLRGEIAQTLRSGQTWQGDFACRRKNGEDYTVRASIAPIFDKDGRVKNYLAIHEDVTAARDEQARRRQLEAQLFQAQKLETIGTLAGGIAHDFNNILTGILGFTEIASLSLPEDHPAHNDLQEVRKAGTRAKDLVAQILTFARQKGAQQVPLELANAVSEALKLVRASTPATIEIERDLQPGRVRADPTAIHQIVLNLCTNAVHAMRGQMGRLTVRVTPFTASEPLADTTPKLKPGNYLCLSVGDTGHGMDEATLKRLFEPFFTTKKAGEGTGLGLALVRGIVNTHGGSLRIASRPGVGTTFDIFLPLCAETEQKTETVSIIVPGNGETIAVIDDEKSVAAFVGARLDQLKYRTIAFNDPREALAAIQAEPSRFDLVVTDFTMPHLTGRDLVEALRTAGIATPAVLMSGFCNDTLGPDEIGHLGRTVLLPKPFNGDDLARAVREALTTQPVGDVVA
ncbi:MAG TPA: PAS domain S-box protein [Opitutaceae bacterium]|nr:PAS domain S-box protein [Opitutaceae bacterium]